MAEIRIGERKLADEGLRHSPKRTRVWDCLQKPKEREPFKRHRVRSPQREEGRIRKPQETMFNNYTPLRTTVERDHGHDTDECHVLKAKVERLVRRGQLKEFVKTDQGGFPGRPKELSPRRNPRHGQDGKPDASPRITGRPLLDALRAVVSPLYFKMKFPTSRRVGEIVGDQKNARTSRENDPRERKSEKRCDPQEELELIRFKEGDDTKTFRLRTRLSPLHREEIISLVQEFSEVFAWFPTTGQA
ncbi:hypothetical protein LIER_01137 [Lithospermum erythrorhizon]|uniref:Uncharacterized protein n=1 Tax=Lithospermum erythrorhizon TaxID=34254 RepID=A0AAV3NLB3_LITER